jgi:hypothetical protein
VLREALRLVRERRLDPGFRRFALASLAASLVLVTASAAASGRGAGSWLEFAEKLSTVTALVATNNVGLKQLATFTSERPEPEPVDGRALVTQASMEALQAKIFAERRLQYLGALAVFLALFFRASRTALDWEAAAMGSTLMLVLTTPASYYLSFVLSAAMLATRRPRIGMALMLTLAAWCLGFASIGRGPLPFVFSSAVGLLFFLYVLVELQLAPAPPAAPERPTAR